MCHFLTRLVLASRVRMLCRHEGTFLEEIYTPYPVTSFARDHVLVQTFQAHWTSPPSCHGLATRSGQHGDAAWEYVRKPAGVALATTASPRV
jgi:hypothetical protein